jgi:hypothetical protein
MDRRVRRAWPPYAHPIIDRGSAKREDWISKIARPKNADAQVTEYIAETSKRTFTATSYSERTSSRGIQTIELAYLNSG